jgi:copper chaperone CopZ
MEKLTFSVENLKCSGCASSITGKLKQIKGIAEVVVDIENETVTVNADETVDRNRVSSALEKLGYPESGNNNLLSKAKSYVSCMTGKLHQKNEEQ